MTAATRVRTPARVLGEKRPQALIDRSLVPLAGLLDWHDKSGEWVALGYWCEYRISIGHLDGVYGYVLLVGGQRVPGSFSRTKNGAKALAALIEDRGRG